MSSISRLRISISKKSSRLIGGNKIKDGSILVVAQKRKHAES
jgi:hypothetical protein